METTGFAVKDCALAAIATGMKAGDLGELSSYMQSVHPGSIYYHFWGGLLRPRFDDREYNNDFAIWVRSPQGMHDEVLAERLSVVDPTEFPDLEGLRAELVDLIEERLYESERLRLVHADRPFHFIRSQIVVFNTGRVIDDPAELPAITPHMSLGSVFYHLIDARRRTENSEDDFRAWFGGFGDDYEDLCGVLAGLDPYFESLAELRQQLVTIFSSYFGGGA